MTTKPWRRATSNAVRLGQGFTPVRREFLGHAGRIALAASGLYSLTSLAAPSQNSRLGLYASFPETSGPGRFLTALCEQLSAAEAAYTTWTQTSLEETLRLSKDPASYFVLSNQELFPFESQQQAAADQLVKALRPVAPLLINPYFVVVSAHSEFKSMGELLQRARQQPGTLRYGSSQTGSLGDKYAAALAHATGTSMRHVVFPGLAALYEALANGEADWAFGTRIGPAAAAYDRGLIRYLAIADASRGATLAAPTLAESGGPSGLYFGAWLGLYAGNGASNQEIERVRKAIAGAVQTPALRRKYPSMPPPGDLTPARLGAYMRQEPRAFSQGHH